MLPDLSDPATLGCLLALVREAWGDPWAHTASSYQEGWVVCASQDRRIFAGYDDGLASEAEALVAALEAAPMEDR